MRASRLLTLLMELQRRGRATAPELAEALEVSVRTIYRDVAALQAAGVPLWTETGRGGGIRVLDGWRTRLDGLTADEAGALFLAGAPAVVAELGLGAELAAAQAKVLATLPADLADRAGRVRQRFHLDATSWFHRAEEVPHLGALADAVWAGRRVDLRYGSWTTPSRLDPLGLVLKGDAWYLVAWSGAERRPERPRADTTAWSAAERRPERPRADTTAWSAAERRPERPRAESRAAPAGSARSYRVARVAEVEVVDEPVTRPDGFDLASWWAASSAAFARTILRSTVRLRVSPLGLRLLPSHLDPQAVLEALRQAGRPDAEGWVELEVRVERDDVAASQLLAVGPHVEVLDPPAVREQLVEGARAVVALQAAAALAGATAGDPPVGDPPPARSGPARPR